MADEKIDDAKIMLFDFWPGVARKVTELPAAFTTAVETAVFGPGEKICIWNSGAANGNAGYATFVYLHIGTQATDNAIAVKDLLVPDSATDPFLVTNDPDETDIRLKTGSPLVGMALATMDDAYWGWCWCGGVCPSDLVSGLDGWHYTDNSVVIGPMVVGVPGADTEAVIGMAYANDQAL